jgi:hypothetical protein
VTTCTASSDSSTEYWPGPWATSWSSAPTYQGEEEEGSGHLRRVQGIGVGMPMKGCKRGGGVSDSSTEHWPGPWATSWSNAPTC